MSARDPVTAQVAPQELIGPAEAARILGITPTRLAQIVRERQLSPALEFPGYRVYDRREVLAHAITRAEQARTDLRLKVPALAP